MTLSTHKSTILLQKKLTANETYLDFNGTTSNCTHRLSYKININFSGIPGIEELLNSFTQSKIINPKPIY